MDAASAAYASRPVAGCSAIAEQPATGRLACWLGPQPPGGYSACSMAPTKASRSSGLREVISVHPFASHEYTSLSTCEPPAFSTSALM